MTVLDETVIPTTLSAAVELIAALRFANTQLTVENWQLKGALGYSVPGSIPQGDFKCGICLANRELLARCYRVLTEQARMDDAQGLVPLLEAMFEGESNVRQLHTSSTASTGNHLHRKLNEISD